MCSIRTYTDIRVRTCIVRLRTCMCTVWAGLKCVSSQLNLLKVCILVIRTITQKFIRVMIVNKQKRTYYKRICKCQLHECHIEVKWRAIGTYIGRKFLCLFTRVVNIVLLVLLPIVSAILFKCWCNGDTFLMQYQNGYLTYFFYLFFGNIRYQYFYH